MGEADKDGYHGNVGIPRDCVTIPYHQCRYVPRKEVFFHYALLDMCLKRIHVSSIHCHPEARVGKFVCNIHFQL